MKFCPLTFLTASEASSFVSTLERNMSLEFIIDQVICDQIVDEWSVTIAHLYEAILPLQIDVPQLSKALDNVETQSD